MWYGAVIRGDHAAVTIGSTANVQSRAVVETVPELESGFPAAVSVGDYSSVGAGATLRSCTIEHSVDVGAGSCVLEGALVQAGVILEPGTVVPPGALVPAGEKWGGRPERGSASNFRRNFDGVFWLRRGYGTDGSRRGRGRDVDIPRSLGRLRVGSSAAVGHKRTEAWIFRGGESRRPQFYGHLEPFGSRAGGNPAAFVAKLSAEEAGAIVERAEALRVEADAASNEYDPPPGAP